MTEMMFDTQVNIMCFLAELLAVFEVQKPDIIKPVHTLDLTGTCMLLLLFAKMKHWPEC